MIQFSDDPQNKLNKQIKKLWNIVLDKGIKIKSFGIILSNKVLSKSNIKSDFTKLVREIYEDAFNEGQEYVWAVRRGDFLNEKREKPKVDYIQTSSDGKNTTQIHVWTDDEGDYHYDPV